MYRRVLSIFFVTAVVCATLANGSGVCTGYPKMYNGKPCASTTRYWDGQMGACGCGSGNTSPFSWQWSKPTAAASAPIYGSGSWCGSGCGKCFKLTPTTVGASVAGKGATNLNPLVVKVTNLCPYAGNEDWCAVDVNKYDYDAHFDLMDYNMNGIITAQGWDNPEVTYEEVDCAANGFGDWSCQCASDSSTGTTTDTTNPTTAAATKPVDTTIPTTAATTKPVTTTTTNTKAPASSGAAIKINVSGGANSWWFALMADKSMFSKVEIMDNDSAIKSWTDMSYQGGDNWGQFYINPSTQLQLPLSFRFTSADGKTVVTASNIINSFTAGEVDTNVAF